MKKLIDCVESALAAAWRRAHAASEVSEVAASVFRIIAGIFLLGFVMKSFSWLGYVPQSFFKPPFFSFATLFDGFPGAGWFHVYDLVAPLLVFFITVGIKARWSGLALVALYLSASSFFYSFGKIDHGILLWVTLLCFSCSNWGTRLAILPDSRVRYHQLPITILGLCIAFGMVTAGFDKALSWIDFDLNTSGFLRWFYDRHFNLDRPAAPLAWLVLHFPSLVVEAVDYMTVFFELSGILFLLLGRVWWKSWLITACVFHALAILFLNIDFAGHFLVYLPFFLPPIVERLTLALSPLQRFWLTRCAFFLAGGLTVMHLGQRIPIGGGRFLFSRDIGLDMGMEPYGSLCLLLGLGLFGLLSIKILYNQNHTDREPL